MLAILKKTTKKNNLTENSCLSEILHQSITAIGLLNQQIKHVLCSMTPSRLLEHMNHHAENSFKCYFEGPQMY